MGSYSSLASISRIAIIGAGPTGLAFAKYLRAEKAFDKIEIFEQRDRVGGIWNLSEPTRTKVIPLPQQNPDYPHERSTQGINGVNRNHEADVDGKQTNGETTTVSEQSLEFESPLYDYLETNIPKPIMQFSHKPFADDLPLYPKHDDVLRYIEEYSEDVKDLIRFRTQVSNVSLNDISSTGADEWQVETKDLDSDRVRSDKFDAVVVASGHYTVPNVPDIKGLKQWSEAYPQSVIHSKAYRLPEHYTNKKVLVIGNSASGLDIASQISRCCIQPILLSSRSVSAFGTMPKASWRKDVDEVVEFLSPEEDDRAVRLASGVTETGIDAVVFCTGYFYSFPFLRSMKPPIVSQGLMVKNTYRHLFNIDHPSMVFPVLNLKIVPFPLAENQAAVVARVWSGRLSLHTEAEMRAWEKEISSTKGDGKYFHVMKFPEDATQMNTLFDWTLEAANRPGLENNGEGRRGTRWNKKNVWLRGKIADIKAQYQSRGEDRSHIKKVEELGFDFDSWRKTASQEELTMFEQARC